jgi:hypothetical protein
MLVVMDPPNQSYLVHTLSNYQITDPAVIVFHVREAQQMVWWAERLKADRNSFNSTCFHFVFFEWDPIDVYPWIVSIARTIAYQGVRRNTWAPWYCKHLPQALRGMSLYCSVRDRDSVTAPDGWKAQMVDAPAVSLYVEGWLVHEFTTERGWNVTKHDDKREKRGTELLPPRVRTR